MSTCNPRHWRPHHVISWLLLALFNIPHDTVFVHARPPSKPGPAVSASGDPVPYLKDLIPPGENFIKDEHYNAAAYGLYVNTTFRTSAVVAPRLNFELPFTACDDGSYIFVTPRGEKIESSAAIIDANGSLIWTPHGSYGQIYNMQVLHYKGNDYVGFWGGNNSVGGHGSGTYYMFDQHYKPFRNVTLANNTGVDLHAFTILPNGNALTTVYEKIPWDISSLLRGGKHHNNWIWDALFREFDLETNEIIFEWRASDYFDVRESWSLIKGYADEHDPWDWFHINMVEKDAAGNYLISSRHLRCLAYIDGVTGVVLWRLGGKQNEFEDLSDGQATAFVGQHDAHWDEGNRFVTLFDNRADWEFEREHVSRGRRIELDFDAMTARINTTYNHPKSIFAFSQGSYQTLPNGNVLLGYGYTGAFAEFAPNGTLLCDASLQPSGRFSSADVQSYRNLKFNWTGTPEYPPSALFANGTVWVSWLGSTEVRGWRVETAASRYGMFEEVVQTHKTGFETEMVLTEDECGGLQRFLRVVALDKAGNVLSTSRVLETYQLPSSDEGHDEDDGEDEMEVNDPYRLPATSHLGGNASDATAPSLDTADYDEVDADETDADDSWPIRSDFTSIWSLGLLAIVASLVIFGVSLRPRMLHWITHRAATSERIAMPAMAEHSSAAWTAPLHALRSTWLAREFRTRGRPRWLRRESASSVDSEDSELELLPEHYPPPEFEVR